MIFEFGSFSYRENRAFHSFIDSLLHRHSPLKYKNYIRLCKSVYRIALLDIVLAKDSVLDVI